jgi:dihydrofolate reductase
MINIIVATDMNGGIGKDNKLLCRLKDDMKHFKEVTEGHIVVMGRKTFMSIGNKLPNRTNIILTRGKTSSIGEELLLINNIEEVLKYNMMYPSVPIFIIGGAEIYKQFLPYASRIYLTRILHEFEADTFFPEINIFEDYHVREQRYFEQNEDNEHPFLISVLDRKVLYPS